MNIFGAATPILRCVCETWLTVEGSYNVTCFLFVSIFMNDPFSPGKLGPTRNITLTWQRGHCSFLVHTRTKSRMRYCEGSKMFLSVRLLSQFFGLSQAFLKYAAIKYSGFLSGFALRVVWVKSTLQLLS